MITLQISQKYLKGLKTRNKIYSISIFCLYVISICIIILMAFIAHSSFDVSSIHQKNINFLYVLSSNFVTMLKSCIYGFISFGAYSTYTFILNITSLGFIINSLLTNNKYLLILKLVPHGLIELFVVSIETTLPIFLWGIIIKNIKPILQKTITVKNLLKKLFHYAAYSILFSSFLLVIAAFIEYLIALVKV